MKVEVNVKVGAHDFYNVLITSLQKEIKDVTRKNVSFEKLQNGYSYKKKSATTKDNVKIKVKQLVMDQIYHVSFANVNYTIDMIYRLEPIDDHSCIVTYEELWDGIKEKKDIFKRPERRMKKTIREVEKRILTGVRDED